MMPRMFPKGSTTAAVTNPCPRSCGASSCVAPIELARSNTACTSSTPGSREALLPPSPLRTVRDSFPSYRSSLPFCPSKRTRLFHSQSLAMHRSVTIGMQQDPVLTGLRSPFGSPDEVVALPPGLLGDLLLALWTATVLFEPEGQQRPSALQVLDHLQVQSLLEILFPRWVIRVGSFADFDMPFDRRVFGPEEIDPVIPVRGVEFPEEDPAAGANGAEVFLRDPAAPF